MMDVAITRYVLAQGYSVEELDSEDLRLQVSENINKRIDLRQKLGPMTKVIARIWRRGDDQAALKLQQELAAPFLCFERNQIWMQKLLPALEKEEHSALVMVGFLHLVGPNGIVSAFEKAGYTATRL